MVGNQMAPDPASPPTHTREAKVTSVLVGLVVPEQPPLLFLQVASLLMAPQVCSMPWRRQKINAPYQLSTRPDWPLAPRAPQATSHTGPELPAPIHGQIRRKFCGHANDGRSE